ncbi:MAG: SIMPL domain-containing protein [Saprospiraceae bacterium]|nr:SIMPL domain-containing protein [Saprospiraceae bacterium]
MKTIYSLKLLILIPLIGYCQYNSDLSILRVISESSLRIDPDIAIMQIRLKHKNENYQVLNNLLEQNMALLTTFLRDLNFQPLETKLLLEEELYFDLYHTERISDTVYFGQKQLDVKMVNNKRNIDNLIRKIRTLGMDLSFSFSFQLSEKLDKKVKEKLVLLATKNAKRHSKIIAKELGCKALTLLKVHSSDDIPLLSMNIDHLWLDYNTFETQGEIIVYSPGRRYLKTHVIMEWQIQQQDSYIR